MPSHRVPAYRAEMGTTARKKVRVLMLAVATRPLATMTKASMLQNAMCHLEKYKELIVLGVVCGTLRTW